MAGSTTPVSLNYCRHLRPSFDFWVAPQNSSNIILTPHIQKFHLFQDIRSKLLISSSISTQWSTFGLCDELIHHCTFNNKTVIFINHISNYPVYSRLSRKSIFLELNWSMFGMCRMLSPLFLVLPCFHGLCMLAFWTSFICDVFWLFWEVMQSRLPWLLKMISLVLSQKVGLTFYEIHTTKAD